MGTTSQKIQYLGETKSLIKDSINLTGANIGSNDTFRSYAVKLRDGLLDIINNGTIVLYNNFPKVSGTGSNISLTNTLEAPMFMNKFDGDTFQQTYTGKNLLNNTLLTQQTTKNNITATPNSDGSITLNGTASANTYFNLANIDFGNTSFNSIDGGSSQYIASTSNSSTDTRIDYSRSNKYTFITILNGVTVNNLKIYPMIRLSSVIDDTFEPYVGGIPSPNPSYPQDIQSVEGIQNITVSDGTNSDSYEVNLEGKNLIPTSEFTLVRGSTRTIQINLPTPLPAGTYTVSWNIENQSGLTNSAGMGWSLYNGTTNVGSLPTLYDEITTTSYTRTTTQQITHLYAYINSSAPSDATITINNLQIEKGSTPTTYVPYRSPIKLYNGDYITGTPDNWVLYKNIGKVVLDGSENWIQNSVYNNVYYIENFLTNAITVEPRPMMSDYFGYGGLLTQGSGAIEIGKFYQWIGLPQRLILGYNSTSLNDFKAWLSTHKTEVLYPLATPTTTPITDTYLISQLNALYNAKSCNGQTNISVSGNLPMILEVSALKDEI